MNTGSVPLARRHRGRIARAGLPAALALLLAALSGPAAAQSTQSDAGGQPIVASLNPPPAGLGCDAAAAATSVYFQFVNPPFQVSQVSLYLDGKGVPQDAVDEHWPTVTLSKGLHPGSNTVDIVANGASGQHIERRMVVQVGGDAGGSAGTAQVACDDAAAAQVAQAAPPAAEQYSDADPVPAEVDEPPPVVVQDSPAVVYQAPPQVVYDYPPPVYVYTPYPVVAFGPWVPFAPFFSFGFFYSNYHPWCPPPRVVSGGWYGGWHGGHGPEWRGGGPGGWHGGNGGGWNGGGGWRGGNGPGRYPSPQAPNGGSGWRGAPRPGAPQPSYTGNGGNGRNSGNYGNYGGWHTQPGPQNRGGWQNAPRPAQPPGQYRAAYGAPGQAYRPPVQQYRPPAQSQFRPAPQQFRPPPQQAFRAPAAPAFHGGGGGGGGGWHGAPAGHGGGGGGFRHH